MTSRVLHHRHALTTRCEQWAESDNNARGGPMDVAVGNERFDRHYRKIRLGLRLMSHRARAQTASDWSGLTLHQLVTLRRRWMPDAEDGFRGPRPTSYAPFFSSALKARHAALVPVSHRMVGITAPVPRLECAVMLGESD